MAGSHIAEVVEVLVDEALLGIDAEGDLERFQGLRADPAVEFGYQGHSRIARHQARQEEIQREARPKRSKEESEPAKGEPHGVLLIVIVLFPKVSQSARNRKCGDVKTGVPRSPGGLRG